MPTILSIHIWRVILMTVFCMAQLYLHVNSTALAITSGPVYTLTERKTAIHQNVSKYSNALTSSTTGRTRKKRRIFTRQSWKAETDNSTLLMGRRTRTFSFRLDSFLTKSSANCSFTQIPDGLKADCSGKQLKRVPMDLPTNITELSLFHNKIAYLPARVFIKYPCLRSLNLSFNLISELVNGSFKGLSKLESLDLSYNKLHLHNCSQVCCNNPFKPLRNLTRLKMKLRLLDHHKPLTLHGCLIDLPNLEDLAISVSDNFTFGPEFSQLNNLRYLDMSDSYMLTHVSKDFFTNLSKCPLRNLSLASCNLFTIHHETLQRLTQLEMLDLSNNTNLGLRNATRCLKGATNSRLQVLRFNTLSNPDSVIVNEEVLEPLSATNLTELYMEWNSIVKIEMTALEKLPVTLETLSLCNNKLTDPYHFLKPLLRLVNLRVLNAKDQDAYIPPHGKSIQTKPVVGGHEYKAEEIKVSSNDVDKGKRVFIPVPPNLEIVRLTKANSFRLGGKHVTFMNSSIKTLILNNNKLQRFSVCILGLNKVEKLDLSYNDLKLKRGFFDGFSGLRSLFLYGNNLNASLASDRGGQMLQSLRHLEEINLGRNQISKLFPKFFKQNGRIRKLILSGNKLTSLGCRINHMTNLTTLDLSKNSFQYLDNIAMKDLEVISRYNSVNVNLVENPLVCSCRSLEFLKWTLSLPPTINLTKIDSILCLAENGSTYISLSHRREIVRELQILCRSYTSLIVGLSLSILTSALVVIVGLVYRYRWKLRYFYHIRLLRKFVRRPKFRKLQGYTPIDGGEVEEAFDIFVAYADEDRGFVTVDMRHVLEDENGFKMYIRDRDSIAGMEIATNITRAVNQSKLTIVLLSNNFMHCKWCMYEFQMARIEGVVRRESVIMYLMYEDVHPTEIPDDLLKAMQHGKLLEKPRHSQSRQDLYTFWTMLIQGIREHNI